MNVSPSYNDFSVTPVSLYTNKSLISFSFMICIYHAGATPEVRLLHLQL
jgi:hypothetical protein